jgi:hypothetical protein
VTQAARLDSWWRTPAPATRLAALRLLVGGFALGYVLIRAPHLAGYADFADTQFAPVGLATLLGGPLPGVVLRLLVAATAVAGLAFVTGWRFRVSGPIFALLLLFLLTYRNSFGQVFHTENILVLHVLVLGLSPAADALSLDSRGRAVPSEAERYGWPVRLMCIVTVLTYFIAGETKLRIAGLDWITSDSLRNYIAYDNVRKIELGDVHSPLGGMLVGHGWLFPPLALLTLAVELGAPLALLGGRIARAWAIVAWGFHAGVVAVMMILFPYPLFGLAFAPFFAVERLPLRLPERLTRGRRLATG